MRCCEISCVNQILYTIDCSDVTIMIFYFLFSCPFEMVVSDNGISSSNSVRNGNYSIGKCSDISLVIIHHDINNSYSVQPCGFDDLATRFTDCTQPINERTYVRCSPEIHIHKYVIHFPRTRAFRRTDAHGATSSGRN